MTSDAAPGDVGEHGEQAVDDLVEVDVGRRCDTDSVSCTSAIDATRRIDSSSAIRASGTDVRRACSRSSAATVCRLFFTRWWISRIVASLLMSAGRADAAR